MRLIATSALYPGLTVLQPFFALQEATEDLVRAHFSRWGTVTDVYFPRHKKTLKRRPFCFVTFASIEVRAQGLAAAGRRRGVALVATWRALLGATQQHAVLSWSSARGPSLGPQGAPNPSPPSAARTVCCRLRNVRWLRAR